MLLFTNIGNRYFTQHGTFNNTYGFLLIIIEWCRRSPSILSWVTVTTTQIAAAYRLSLLACRTIDLNRGHSNTHISPQGIFLKWDCTTPTYFNMVNVEQFLCWSLTDFKLSGSNIFDFYSASAKKIQLPLNVTKELPLIWLLAVLFCLVLSYLGVVGDSY